MTPLAPYDAWCIVVAGPSGVGKSTTAARIAVATGAVLADGDDLHSAEAVRKMRAGQPLDDADRLPWLTRIGEWIDHQHGRDARAVISCSALRRAHRDVLTAGRSWVRFCLLELPTTALEARLAARTDHYMPVALLPSQLAVLEPLGGDEAGVTLDATAPPAELAATALDALGLSGSAPPRSTGR